MADEQMSFASVSFDRFAKTTRRAKFLDEMDRILPWQQLCELVRVHYPTGEGGRPPIDLERMLRIYFLQQWFNLSDPGVEETLYNSTSMLRFVGIDLGREAVPDETTVCKFRHLLEKHKLGERIFAEVNAYLRKSGVKVSTGTIVDASIISAPSSTKNRREEARSRDAPDQEGQSMHFGIKAHIGVDSRTRTIHTVAATAANVHDSKMLAQLLHGKERRVYGDSAYRGQRGAIRARARHARDFTNRRAYTECAVDASRSRDEPAQVRCTLVR